MTNQRSRRPIVTAAVGAAATCLVMASAFGALAAEPQPGKRYAGFSSLPRVEGFRAPVSFRTDARGRRLVAFTFHALGCFVADPLLGNDVYLDSVATHRVGTITVAASGSFSADGRRSFNGFGHHERLVTISSVRGRFTSPTDASGTIVFRQHVRFNGRIHRCRKNAIRFRVRRRG